MGSIRSWSNSKVWLDGTVKVTASPRVERGSEVPAGVVPVSDTAGRGLNTGVEEEGGGLDDCCGLKGLRLLKKFTIPSKKVV